MTTTTSTRPRKFRFDCADASITAKVTIEGELPTDIEHQLDHLLQPAIATMNELGCVMRKLRPDDATDSTTSVSDTFEQKAFGLNVHFEITAKLNYGIADDSTAAQNVLNVLRAVTATFGSDYAEWATDLQGKRSVGTILDAMLSDSPLAGLVDIIGTILDPSAAGSPFNLGVDLDFGDGLGGDFLFGGRSSRDRDPSFARH